MCDNFSPSQLFPDKKSAYLYVHLRASRLHIRRQIGRCSSCRLKEIECRRRLRRRSGSSTGEDPRRTRRRRRNIVALITVHHCKKRSRYANARSSIEFTYLIEPNQDVHQQRSTRPLEAKPSRRTTSHRATTSNRRD